MNSEPAIRTLVVQPDGPGGGLLRKMLLARGHDVTAVPSWEAGWAGLEQRLPALVFFPAAPDVARCRADCARVRALAGGGDVLLAALWGDMGAAGGLLRDCALDEVIPLPFDAASLELRLAVIEARIRERRRRAEADAALRASEQRFRTLVEASPLGIAVFRGHRAVFANHALARLGGFASPDQILAVDSFARMTHPDDLPRLEAFLAGLIGGAAAPAAIEFRGLRRDGSTFWARAEATTVEWDGKPGMLVALSDVSARVKFEEDLRASQGQLQAVFDGIPYDLFVKDRSGVFVIVNKAMERTFGIPASALLGRQVASPGQISEADLAAIQSSDRAALDEGRTVESLRSRTLPGGEVRHYRVIKTPLRDAAGAVSGMLGIAEDITERQRAQDELKVSQTLLRTVFDTIPHDVFVKDRHGGYITYNKAMAATFQRDPAGAIGQQVASPGHTPDHERAAILDSDRAVLEEGRTVEHVVPRTLPSGEVRHFRVVKTPLRDAAGAVSGLVGVAEDITKRLTAERELQAGQRLMRVLIDSLPQSIYFKDAAGRYRLVNAAMAGVHGLAPGDFIGKTIAELPFRTPEEVRRIQEADATVLETGRPLEMPEILVAVAGRERWERMVKVPLRGQDGAPDGIVGIAEDITERKRAADELRASQRLLRAVYDAIPHALWVKDHEGRFLVVNEPMARRFKRRPEEYVGLATATLPAAPDAERKTAAETDRQVLREGRNVDLERSRTLASGEVRLERVLKRPLRDESGRVTGLVGLAEDITEQRRGEEALRQSQALLQTVFDTVPHLMFVKDADSRYVIVNKAVERVWGVRQDEVVGARVIAESRRPAEEIEAALRSDRAVFESGKPATVTYSHTLPDGRSRLLRIVKSPIFDAQGQVAGIVGMAEDVTEPVQAMNELRASQRLLRTLIDALPQSIYFKGPNGRYQLVNEAMARLYGMRPDQFIGRAVSELPYGSPEELERKLAMDAEVMRRGETVDTPELLVSLAGQTRWEHIVKVPLRGADGTPLGIVGIAEDITQRKRAQDEVRASQRLLNAMMDAMPQSITVKFPDGRFRLVNQTSAQWFGLPVEQLVGGTLESLGFKITDFLARVREGDAAVLGTGRAVELPDMSVTFGDGSTHWVHVRKLPLAGEDGAVEAVLTIMDDVSARKQAEAERLALERQVLHAQKLESLGVLAGGIAHDFNNLLTGVLGNVELAELDAGPHHPAAPALESIRQASLRAAGLTQQMLAYSGRGRFQIQDVDLNRLVTEMTQLLKVSISKKIALRFDLAPEAPLVEGDAVQLQQVVMNLITNAAEAIGDAAGEIRLSTGLLARAGADLAEAHLAEYHRDGPYAFLDVTDTGCGMSAEVKARIFDPFFTTKFTGRGLGLAAVLGIVRSHRGLIRIRTAPGAGSSFRVLIPPVERPGAHPAAPVPAAPPAPWQGHGTILLVDDEALVRAVMERQLQRLGFQVLTAGDGREALRRYRAAAGGVRAVLLDMTMPEMDGAETLQELKRLSQELPVIVCSGYAQFDAVQQFGTLAPDAFLQKPVPLQLLSDTLRQVLRG
jgi:PAS domain S-box-containing protein